jgi:hypothetical protein
MWLVSPELVDRDSPVKEFREYNYFNIFYGPIFQYQEFSPLENYHALEGLVKWIDKLTHGNNLPEDISKVIKNVLSVFAGASAKDGFFYKKVKVNDRVYYITGLIHAYYDHGSWQSYKDRDSWAKFMRVEQFASQERISHLIEEGRNIIDPAMNNSNADATRGGIDFNSANLDLQIKRDGHGVPLPLAQQDMAQLSRIQGFEPEIIEIKPAVNVPIISELQNLIGTH